MRDVPAVDRRHDRDAQVITEMLTVDLLAERCGVTVRRVRYLERAGLIEATTVSRSARLYDQRAFERVMQIERLTHDLGVNTAGAEVILNMRDRMIALLAEIERLRHGQH